MRRFPLSPDAGFLRKSSKLSASEDAIQPSGTAKPAPESTRFKNGSRAVLIVKQGGPTVSAGWTDGYGRGLYRRFSQVRPFAPNAPAVRFVSARKRPPAASKLRLRALTISYCVAVCDHTVM